MPELLTFFTAVALLNKLNYRFFAIIKITPKLVR